MKPRQESVVNSSSKHQSTRAEATRPGLQSTHLLLRPSKNSGIKLTILAALMTAAAIWVVDVNGQGFMEHFEAYFFGASTLVIAAKTLSSRSYVQLGQSGVTIGEVFWTPTHMPWNTIKKFELTFIESGDGPDIAAVGIKLHAKGGSWWTRLTRLVGNYDYTITEDYGMSPHALLRLLEEWHETYKDEPTLKRLQG